ncbi:MAG: phosphotransferase [Aeromicrobium sp.]
MDQAGRSESRRQERQAIAESLLSEPPPVDDLQGRVLSTLDGRVLHASRSRPVVQWTLSVNGDGPARTMPVVGKGFLRGGGEQAWQLLRRLRVAGFDDAAFSVPQPYGFDPVRQLLAQEAAPARTLHDGLIDDPSQVADVRRVAHWLARLHDIGEVGLSPLPANFELEKLSSYSDALVDAVPRHGARVQTLVTRTTQALAHVTGPCVTTHGDFQPKNIHLNDQRVVVIDFDRAASAPAARDVGHFIGQTLTMAASRHGSIDAATSWVDAFVPAYLEAGGGAGVEADVPAYVARTFSEVLFYRLVVRPVADFSFVPGWLDEWEWNLEQAEQVTS